MNAILSAAGPGTAIVVVVALAVGLSAWILYRLLKGAEDQS